MSNVFNVEDAELYFKRIQKDKTQSKERSRRYYEKHKKRLSKNRESRRITCCCGSRYMNVPSIRNRHLKTKKHMKYVEKISNEKKDETQNDK